MPVYEDLDSSDSDYPDDSVLSTSGRCGGGRGSVQSRGRRGGEGAEVVKIDQNNHKRIILVQRDDRRDCKQSLACLVCKTYFYYFFYQHSLLLY